MSLDDLLGLLPLLIFLLIVFAGFGRRRQPGRGAAPPPPRPAEPEGEVEDVRDLLRELFGERSTEPASRPAQPPSGQAGTGPSSRPGGPARPGYGPASQTAVSLEAPRLEARRLAAEETAVTAAAKRARESGSAFTAPELEVERLAPAGVEPARLAAPFLLDRRAIVAAVVLGDSMSRRKRLMAPPAGERRGPGPGPDPAEDTPARPGSREGSA
jgi:hypothetical protein